MNQLQIFNNHEFGEIRMVEIDGKPYAVGVDVARALGYARPHEAIQAHCRGAVIYRIIDSLGREQEAKIIPEGDIYRLIVKAADQSKNPDIKERAERFERWIFEEVLPQLRQKGYFSIRPMTQIQILQQAINILAEHEQKLLALEEKQQILQHRIDNLDAINIEGDLQQKLNKLIRKYAFKNGIIFSIAWEHFKQAYNTAYRTNLELLMRNYAEREGMKGLTIPQYLALTGRLEDGIRVADKMLNDTEIAQGGR
ncbi:MAG: BRO family protein [Thermoanaerobacterium sp.]|nr:BRO family protein [Thermoanaerobacterium sp.]